MTSSNEFVAIQASLNLLERASELAETLLDNLPSAHIIINDEGKVLRANSVFCSQFGFSLEGIINQNIVKVFSTANRESFMYQLRQLDHSNDSSHSRKFLLDACSENSSEPTPYQWSISKFESGQSDSKHFSVIGEDVSKIYQYETKLAKLFSGLPVGIILLSSDGIIEEVMSDRANELLDREDIKGVPFSECISKFEINNGLSKQENAQLFEKSASVPEGDFEHWKKLLPSLIKNESDTVHWLKVSYHPIIQNNTVSKLMVFLEDQTEAVNYDKQQERINTLEIQSKKLYESAIRDPLTGLYNRLYMQDGTMSMFANFQRDYIGHLAILMMDIDHFKQINDNYGHQMGDEVIARVGHIIADCIRKSDLAIRYGGEEFLILNSNKEYNEDFVGICAERIREKIEKETFQTAENKTVKVTISGGVSVARRGETLEESIGRADQLLYQAKNLGRNQIVLEKTSENAS